MSKDQKIKFMPPMDIGQTTSTLRSRQAPMDKSCSTFHKLTRQNELPCGSNGTIPERPFPKRPLPKTTVSRPIIEFCGMEVFFLLVDSRPFLEAAFLGKAFLHVTALTRVHRIDIHAFLSVALLCPSCRPSRCVPWRTPCEREPMLPQWRARI